MGLIDHRLPLALAAGLPPGTERHEFGRFYFHLTNGLLAVPDPDGAEATGPDQAVEQARCVMEELREAGDLPQASEGWQIEVTDASGAIVDTIKIV